MWKPKTLITTSIFVSNIPDGVYEESLKEKFKSFGELVSVYLARKNDKFGNNFGFIRYLNVEDKETFVKSFGDIFMDGAKLGANLAINDKRSAEGKKPMSNSSKNYSNKSEKSYVDRPVGSHTNFNQNQNFTSYKEALTNANRKVHSKTIILTLKVTGAAKEWKSASLVGEARSLSVLYNVQKV